MIRSLTILVVLAVAWATGLPRLDAAPPEMPETAAELGTGQHELVPMPTLGGKQFWADELLFHQWRIQRNAVTGQCRLIDPDNLRHASGTLDECRNKLDEIKRLRQLPPMDGRAVIVLHGLNRSRRSMDKLCTHLREKGGYTVFNVTYPSTRRSIDDHAQSLGRIVENLDGIDEINLVGHSLGNIVIRRWLFDQIDPATGRFRDARLKRLVMLGPPNHGSSIAAAFGENRAFGAVEGASGRELGVDWAESRAQAGHGPDRVRHHRRRPRRRQGLQPRPARRRRRRRHRRHHPAGRRRRFPRRPGPALVPDEGRHGDRGDAAVSPDGPLHGDRGEIVVGSNP